LYNQMDLTWNNPTNGLDSGTLYEYSYSVTESSTGTVIYEGMYDDGNIETHELVISDTVADLTESIASATTYDFSVKLVADKMETLTSAGFYETIEMESNEATVKCYTNPAQLSGLNVDSTTYESVTLSWSSYSDLDLSQFKEYSINLLWTENGTDITRTISSLTNSFEITALDSNTSYTAWVKVDSVDYGASDWSDSINFVTNELLVDNMEMIDQLKYIYETAEAYYNETLSDLESTTMSTYDMMGWPYYSWVSGFDDFAPVCEINYSDFNLWTDITDMETRTLTVEEHGSVWFDMFRTSDFDIGTYNSYEWVTYDDSRSSSTALLDITTGYFEAPIDGHYAFSFQALSSYNTADSGEAVVVTMNVVGKRGLGSSRDADDGHRTTISIHAIADLTAGEFVAVKTQGYLQSGSTGAIQFTGRLIAPA